MGQDARDRTLGLLSIWQILKKLEWEINIFNMLPSRIRIDIPPGSAMEVEDAKIYAAINAVSTSVVMIDWLYHQLIHSENGTQRLLDYFEFESLKGPRDFREKLRELNPKINICHQICNANKHLMLGDYTHDIDVFVANSYFEHPDGKQEIELILNVRQGQENLTIGNILIEVKEWWVMVLNGLNVEGKDIFY